MKKLYARARVTEYWLVDPEKKTIEVFTLGQKGFDG
ncbi:MAG: Uma2 family endonuclease, partial [Candidatus Bipolaricaulota bacterium]|nr:Uma2 family endonuclease [Candidatus Bipolaricaulota bacterium]MDW8141736.1 Uma2 family endonuclease [Candidatus Bipolaricaulota bacterium]